MDRPNIIYLHSHDTGRYVQPYGHAVSTPNIQRLAEEGVLFRQAFCAAPTCSPSRAALLTGQSAHASGMAGLAHRGFLLADYRQHIIHALRQAGYTSALTGVQHVAPRDHVDWIGYDQVLPPAEGKEGPGLTAAEFLKVKPREPFFLSAGFFPTHRIFTKTAPVDDPRYTLPPPQLPDTPETRQDMAEFKTSARELDRGIGHALNALRESDLARRTLVICTTDHGIAFPKAKCNLTDQGIGVMLILRGPGGFTGGKVIDSLVSQVDLFPTICELAGIEAPEWLEGRSILPLIRGEKDAIREAVFAEVNYHTSYEPMRCVRTQRHKYIQRHAESRRPMLSNCDPGPSKSLWMAHGWQDRCHAGEELYDLMFDPLESCNLAADPAMASVLVEMRARLHQWMTTTGDPLLRGPVPAPKGAVVNFPEAIDPTGQAYTVA